MSLLIVYLALALAGATIAFWRQPPLPQAWPLLLGAAAPQLLSMYGIRGLALFAMTTAALAVWCWRNRALPGAGLVSAGFALNLLVMGLHGGAMPIDSQSLLALGQVVAHGDVLVGSKDLVVNNATLGFLGDWIVIDWLPVRLVASPGDLLVLVGIVWWLMSGSIRSTPHVAQQTQHA